MKKKGHLYLIMWTAGAGKGTLRKWLEALPDLWIEFAKSYVSRPMREGEIDGDIYHFISEEDFKEMIDAWDFLEYEVVHKTAYYGTKLSDVVDDWIEMWKKVMKEIDIEWLKNILSNNSQLRKSLTSIFLSLSPGKMSERIAARWATMTEEEYKNREESLIKEVWEAEEYCDYIIDTSTKTPEEVLAEALKIISKK